MRDSIAVFLVGAECPFACVFCDLWRHSLETATPPGALPAQLAEARRELGGWGEGAILKLYNGSNFFDPRAVPAVDRPVLAHETKGAGRVVVECHPRLLADEATVAGFAAAIAPARLEIALGLEVADPPVHRELGKGTEVADFERAAARLGDLDLDWRAFVLVGAPFVAAARRVESAIESARWAAERGARHVSLIPTRTGNVALEKLAREGRWAPPTLTDLERALEGSLRVVDPRRTTVTADLWDLERFSRCKRCLPDRRRRLERINLEAAAPASIACAECG